MKILIRKINGIVTPEPEYIEEYNNIKENVLLSCDLTAKRNIKFHKKYFKLILTILECQDTHKYKDDLRADIMFRIKETKKILCSDMKVREIPKSISFANMDQLEFERIYNKTVQAGLDILRDEGKGKFIEEYENILVKF
jgi:hypothetical protein